MSQRQGRRLALSSAQAAVVLQAEHLSPQPCVLVTQGHQLTVLHQVLEPPFLPGPLGGLVVLESLTPVDGIFLVVRGHLSLAARTRGVAAACAQTKETSSQ